jgi:excisionase family DNA binding protein
VSDTTAVRLAPSPEAWRDCAAGEGSTPLASSIEPLLLTAREAAAALRISERSLWGLTRHGEVRAVRIGRAVRYDPRDLREYINGLRANANGQEG